MPRVTAVILFGRSMGSLLAVHLAAIGEDRFAALILESAIAALPRGSTPPTVGGTLPSSNSEKLLDVTLPTLILHGEGDEILPVEHAKLNFAAAAASTKKLVMIPERGHNDLVSSDTYFKSIAEFLDTDVF